MACVFCIFFSADVYCTHRATHCFSFRVSYDVLCIYLAARCAERCLVSWTGCTKILCFYFHVSLAVSGTRAYGVCVCLIVLCSCIKVPLAVSGARTDGACVSLSVWMPCIRVKRRGSGVRPQGVSASVWLVFTPQGSMSGGGCEDKG